MITTFQTVAAHLAEVTAEQIGRCHRITDFQAKPVVDFYKVENERGDLNADGEILEYEVRYEAELGFSCTCKSGQYGFHNVHHASGVCKHVRWSVAAAIEERQAMQEIAHKQAAEEEARRQDLEAGTRPHRLEIAGREATPREYARVMAAQGTPPTEAEIKRDQKCYAPKPFKII
ncbi:hypothetical protein KDA_77190 [Dictyobacter alpinus]|uniref:SWIM-type domain-containing protein n=1 Tax=Dictyobacter alpinus TaxID=2014873 RepID=A0A402BLI5_9CHLR|nr:hypothetical protein [Dictyobacter alpinus]GCE32235.1 hypothetical protein KDA_77190 [Dictyobacter alpinus]